MKWRPEGWKNEHQDRVAREPNDDIRIKLTVLSNVYEAGADAMLEALKARAIRCDYSRTDLNIISIPEEQKP